MVTKKHTTTSPNRIGVTFAVPGSIWADTIHLVGDFNNWSKTATPLRLDERGWSVTLDLERDRSYQFCYLVDSREWMGDWNADRHTLGRNGLVTSVVVTHVPQAGSAD